METTIMGYIGVRVYRLIGYIIYWVYIECAHDALEFR